MQLFRRPQADITGLVELLGRQEQPLAQASGDDLALIGTRTALAYRAKGQWQVWGWEEVAGGSWDAQKKRFAWRTVTGESFAADLIEAGAFPELFQERVQASTVVTTVLDTPTGQVQVIARRGLGDEGKVRFYAISSEEADLTDPATRDRVIAERQRLRSEFL